VSTPEQQAFWILRAQYGDRDALERLLESAQAPLGRYICGLVGSDAAEDVLQNVLLQIFRRLPSLEDPVLFRAWAFRIASGAERRPDVLGPDRVELSAIQRFDRGCTFCRLS
jgi:hypothetical protein